MSTDDRQAAERRVSELISLLRAQPDAQSYSAIIDEAEALQRAIGAFHLEGIRFRMYNVDRAIAQRDAPADARAIVADVHRHLEAAGFHTRSHQAPTT
ncbi:MAG TPA: hypothetical protein VFK20_06950 [Vicinamibacterales bacterium]|nr:hypothetical protein [Vicinamibacterales bacterium]